MTLRDVVCRVRGGWTVWSLMWRVEGRAVLG